MSEAAPTASPSEALPPVARSKPGPRRGPPVGPARPSPSAAPRSGPRARWTDTLTGLLLCVATGGVLFAASPALLRAAGLGAPSRDDGELRNGGRLTLPQPPVGAPAHPIFSHGDDDEDEGAGRSHMAPPGDRSRSALPRDPRAPAAASTAKRAIPGIVRRPIKLFEQPGAGGIVLGEVETGDLVMIGKEVGDWVLVAHDGADGVVMGWAKKSEIAVK